eukprot:8957585-Pyramimonas_sp.AAC.1
MHEVDTDPALAHVAAAPGLLGCYLRNRVRAAKEAGEEYDVEALAAHAVDYGCPELAEAAEAFLQRQYGRSKAGEVTTHQAVVVPIAWGEGDEPGKGALVLAG